MAILVAGVDGCKAGWFVVLWNVDENTSKQCFAILPKIREVDRFMTPERQRSVFEIHPELCFLGMNNPEH